MFIPFTTVIPTSKNNNHQLETFIIDSTVLLTTTSAASLAGCSNEANKKEIENKSLNAFVESLSDEELEMTLQKFSLLSNDNNKQKIK